MRPLVKEAACLSALIPRVGRDIDALHARARDRARAAGRPVVVSLTVGAEAVDPVAVFERAAVLGRDRALWIAPGGEMALAALGAAAVLEAGGTAGLAPVAALRAAWHELLAGAAVEAPPGVWGAGPLLVGGFAFDPAAAPDPVWAGFPAARFVLPEVLVTVTGGRAWLTCNGVVVPGDLPGEAAWELAGGVRLRLPATAGAPAGERARRWLALLAASGALPAAGSSSGIAASAGGSREGGAAPGSGTPLAASAAAAGTGRAAPGSGGLRAGAAGGADVTLPGTGEDPGSGVPVAGTGRGDGGIEREEWPPAGRWQAMVAAALEAIGRGALHKVVLSRRVRVRGPAAFDPGLAVRRLRAAYPGCFVFAVARDREAFVGATPERLVRLRGGRLDTAALAGSTARGATPEADERLGRALLASPKERAEHALVVEMLRQALAPLCRVLSVPPEPRLLRLGNVQHLYTPISGAVEGRSVLELVERLHPTPAVGGWPRAAALEFIRTHEPGSRGWYAAPVGWVDRRGEGEFAVAIRSGLLRGAEAWLFAGCGIVAGSDPAREYEETRLKLRPLLAALGVEPAPGEEPERG